MTDKMQNALNHLKTAVDVDPWALEEFDKIWNAAVNSTVKCVQQIIYEESEAIKNGKLRTDKEILYRISDAVEELKREDKTE